MAWWKQWGRDEDKMFEEALVRTENDPNRFETIASYLQMPLEVVKHYYDALVHDVELIESGQYGTTDYQDYAVGLSSQTTKHMKKNKKRGRHWTAKEHGDFLKGLDEFGRGDWKNISRKYVKTRTLVQIASHAQKYFQRQEMESEAKKRSSINDITLVDDNSDVKDVPAPRSDLEGTMIPAHFGQQTPQFYHQ